MLTISAPDVFTCETIMLTICGALSVPVCKCCMLRGRMLLWSVLVLSSFVLWVSGFDSSNAPCAGFLFNGPSSCWRIDLLDGSVGCESCELIVILSVAAWSFVIVWGLMVCAQECRSAVPIRCQSVYERAFINAVVMGLRSPAVPKYLLNHACDIGCLRNCLQLRCCEAMGCMNHGTCCGTCSPSRRNCHGVGGEGLFGSSLLHCMISGLRDFISSHFNYSGVALKS